MTLLADFESANLQALKNAGYSGICRYLSFPPNGKNITQTEWAAALALGLTVNLNWEEDAQDMAKGAPVGVSQGHEANVLASALNPPLPMTRPIIYSADWDCQPAQYNAVEAYLRAAAAQGRPAGVYGKNALVDEMMRRGAAVVGWVASAWLYGQTISPRAALFQRLKPTLASGQNIDEDVVVNGAVDYGQYPLTVTPTPIPSTPIPSTISTVLENDMNGIALGLSQPHEIETFRVDSAGNLIHRYYFVGGPFNSVAPGWYREVRATGLIPNCEVYGPVVWPVASGGDGFLHVYAAQAGANGGPDVQVEIVWNGHQWSTFTEA